jgi:hypothetical protein
LAHPSLPYFNKLPEIKYAGVLEKYLRWTGMSISRQNKKAAHAERGALLAGLPLRYVEKGFVQFKT